MAREVFRSFVQRWLSRGLLEEMALPEDLAHLSNSAVKLNVLEEIKTKSPGIFQWFHQKCHSVCGTGSTSCCKTITKNDSRRLSF